jgi:hypothetical protein
MKEEREMAAKPPSSRGRGSSRVVPALWRPCGLAALPLAILGCAGAGAKVDEPRAVHDAGPTAAPTAPPAASERPFASTALEAQSLIQKQIDEKRKALWKCVEDYRARIGDPHRAVTVDIGLDQEGHLIGVADTAHGGLDPALGECMTQILRLAPFPRSHTGVITVKQVFQDAAVYR